MAVGDVLLAVLRDHPRHGYEVKHAYDAWFPDARPLAFGQVYATLARLERDGLVEVVDQRSEGAAERTVYAITALGTQRLDEWLAEPVPPAGPGQDEIIRKAVAAFRTGAGAAAFLSRQRAAHLRRMRELTAAAAGGDAASRLAREHTIAHLDADLRWLDLAVELVGSDGGARTGQPSGGRSEGGG
ncbi:PadR family transcriptional regulator [Pseudonocardia nigra]|uniref:PadR family transcriptional regulator n=1 Tax=Pseudonocardia nigra TaxID=1921578 RepID=UPI001C5DF87B|nr:PadR family transcriptional regulator [Pseudonocardia nigra]